MPRSKKKLEDDVPVASIPLSERVGWSYISYLVVSFFFPPLALLIPILIFYREVTWAVAIAMICGVLFVPAGIVSKLYALVIALVCLWCLNSKKIVAWLNRTPRRRKKFEQDYLWSRRMAFAFAILFVPVYLYAAIVWSLRRSP